jgi:ATP adenylyltransferase
VCPALQFKPKLPTPNFAPEAHQSANPFLPPYVPNLYVGELASEDGDHVILVRARGLLLPGPHSRSTQLNKYSVVPEHFLLVTREQVSQQSPLFPADLVHTYDLLDAARAAGRPSFAFYNCGDRSGASQHHKHLQVLPTEPAGPPIERLARAATLQVQARPFTLSALPYANHVVRLPLGLASFSPDARAQVLTDAFLSVLDLAIATVRHDPTYPAGAPSYNVLLTPEHIHVIPRRLEHATLASGEPLSVNSLAFAGYVLVKSDQQLAAVKDEVSSAPSDLKLVLTGVCTGSCEHSTWCGVGERA